MARNALSSNVERRDYRRVSDAVALHIESIEGQAANDCGVRTIELPDHPTHVVNLSPSGLKCFHHEPFTAGDLLSISLRLFPSDQRLDLKGRVVSSGEDGQKGVKDRFFAGIAFKGVSEEQQQLILGHIEGVARKSFGGAVKLIYKK